MKKTIALIDFLPISGTCTGMQTQIRIMATECTDKYRFIVIGSNGSILEKNEENLPYIFYGLDSAVALSELYFHPWSTILSYIKTCISISKILIREHVDLLHCYHYMWSPYVSPIGFLFGKPVIIHLKDVWLLKPKIARILMKCNPYSTYIAVSKYVYTLFTGQFGIPISNTVTIYDGIDTSLFTLPDHETITNKFRTKYKSLIMISRISPERDIEIFIDMAYLLSKKYPDMKFFHYGMKSDHVQKDYVISLKNRIRLLKLVKKLQLKQYVTSPKKIALILQKSFMSIVPARSFALPNVAIESQLCGTPVIALDIGGNSEVLTNKTGTVLTSSSSILFAQAVESYIADPRKYFNAIVTGERVSKKKFNAINQFKKIQKLYDSILNDQ